MVRRFGPTRAAGVRIEEQDGDKTITPGALGWAGMAGIAEKGPPNKMVLCSTKTEYIKWFGNITTDGLMTDCAYDFFDLANGAGGLAVVRVTDGNELQASYTVFNRRTGSAQGPVGVIKALNGGRWGGKEKRHAGTMLNIGSLTNTTLQVEAAFSSTFKTDELKGGYIALSNVANKLYPIVGNTSAGLITVASDQTMLTDYNVLGGSVFGYQVTLENDGKAISIQPVDGPRGRALLGKRHQQQHKQQLHLRDGPLDGLANGERPPSQLLRLGGVRNGARPDGDDPQLPDQLADRRQPDVHARDHDGRDGRPDHHGHDVEPDRGHGRLRSLRNARGRDPWHSVRVAEQVHPGLHHYGRRHTARGSEHPSDHVQAVQAKQARGRFPVPGSRELQARQVPHRGERPEHHHYRGGNRPDHDGDGRRRVHGDGADRDARRSRWSRVARGRQLPGRVGAQHLAL